MQHVLLQSMTATAGEDNAEYTKEWERNLNVVGENDFEQSELCTMNLFFKKKHGQVLLQIYYWRSIPVWQHYYFIQKSNLHLYCNILDTCFELFSFKQKKEKQHIIKANQV